ncbi:MAG: hypothetical protein AVDCRST_MAG29-1254, partial [uncultured Nocardioidaceae bacterium]
ACRPPKWRVLDPSERAGAASPRVRSLDGDRPGGRTVAL